MEVFIVEGRDLHDHETGWLVGCFSSEAKADEAINIDHGEFMAYPHNRYGFAEYTTTTVSLDERLVTFNQPQSSK